MSSMTQIPVESPGGYRIQHTDVANGQIRELEGSLRNRVQEVVHEIANGSPYARGIQVDGIRDRRNVSVQEVDVLYWVTNCVPDGPKVVTVVSVTRASGREHPGPLPDAIPRPQPFIDTPEDEDALTS